MTESNPQLPAPIPASKPARPPRIWPLWSGIIIALVAVIVLALWSWQQWQHQQQLTERLALLQDSNRQFQQREQQGSTEISQRLRALEDRIEDQRNAVATQQRQIDHNARELLNAGNRNRTDWLLAESEYLLRVGNQRLLIEKDIRGALAALQSADEVLRETDDIGVYPVREQLAREILALRNLRDVDRTGLYLQLEALREQVTRLTEGAVIGSQEPAKAMNTSGADQPGADQSTVQSAFQRGWQQFRDSLQEVIVIRRMDATVEPMMSPDQSAWARLNLQLMLEQAELAVLRGHGELYQQTLDKALDALNTWFDDSDNRIATLKESVAELRNRNIDPPLPDISRSLTLLKGRIAGRDQPDTEAANGESDGGNDS